MNNENAYEVLNKFTEKVWQATLEESPVNISITRHQYKALENAVRVVGKQIPVMVEEIDDEYGVCPRCKTVLDKLYNENGCGKCLTALKWEE